MRMSGLNKVIVACATGGVFVAVLSLGGCKHEPLAQPEDVGILDTGYNWVPPPDTTPPAVICDPDTVFFEQSVLPLLVSFCATEGCHDAISHEEGVRLYDYAHIMQQVQPGNPNNSDLMTDGIWENGNDQMPPASQPQLTSDRYQYDRYLDPAGSSEQLVRAYFVRYHQCHVLRHDRSHVEHLLHRVAMAAPAPMATST